MQSTSRVPLSTLLSQLLVAFTIEFDNEFEHRMPHRTSRRSAAQSGGGPWLTSMVMWENFMRYLPESGVPLKDLKVASRITNLKGLERWRYITVGPDPGDPRPEVLRRDWVVRPTSQGILAQKTWLPIASEIEDRWKLRHGAVAVDGLAKSLGDVASQIDLTLPRYMPVVGYGLPCNVSGFSEPATLAAAATSAAAADADSGLELSVLLSRVLMAFTVEFERESKISLAICANVLRVLGENVNGKDLGGAGVAEETGLRFGSLPRTTGVSTEAVKMAVGYLERNGFALVEQDPATARGKLVRLTTKGQKAYDEYRRILYTVDKRWRSYYGDHQIATLRESLAVFVGDPPAVPSPLLQSLVTYPDGWRSQVRSPQTFPHHPMVLHRGGYPDGS